MLSSLSQKYQLIIGKISFPIFLSLQLFPFFISSSLFSLCLVYFAFCEAFIFSFQIFISSSSAVLYTSYLLISLNFYFKKTDHFIFFESVETCSFFGLRMTSMWAFFSYYCLIKLRTAKNNGKGLEEWTLSRVVTLEASHQIHCFLCPFFSIKMSSCPMAKLLKQYNPKLWGV